MSTETKRHRGQWLLLSPLGLVLIGLGVSVTTHAGGMKERRVPGWVGLGTLGLILLNSGIAVFGEAIKHRTLLELARR